MKTVCFTGRISRLVNSLSGFTNIVKIGITDKSQIEAKYNLLQKKLKQRYDDDSLEYYISFKYMFNELLYEIECKTIKEWIDPFNDIIIGILEDEKLTWDDIDTKLKQKVDGNVVNKFIVEYRDYLFDTNILDKIV